MVDIRDVLKDRYKQCSQCDNIKEDFEKECSNYFANIDRNSCFKLLPFYDAQREFHKNTSNATDLRYLEYAMENLEKYTLNLLRKPWCKDFYTIKIFNGFFKYKIEQWISFDIASKILDLIGYHNTSPGIFTRDLDMAVDERVLVVSFELYLARVLTKLFRSQNNSVGHLMDTYDDDVMPFKITNNLEQFSIGDKLEKRQNTVTTREYRGYFDKNGQSTELSSPEQVASFNPDDIDDVQLYGVESPTSNCCDSLSDGVVVDVYQHKRYEDITGGKKYNEHTQSGLYENIEHCDIGPSIAQNKMGHFASGYGQSNSAAQACHFASGNGQSNSAAQACHFASGYAQSNLAAQAGYFASGYGQSNLAAQTGHFASGYGQSNLAAQAGHFASGYGQSINSAAKVEASNPYSSMPVVNLSPSIALHIPGSKDDSHIMKPYGNHRNAVSRGNNALPQTSQKFAEDSSYFRESSHKDHNGPQVGPHGEMMTELSGQEDALYDKQRIEEILNKRIKGNESSPLHQKSQQTYYDSTLVTDDTRNEQRKITCFICSGPLYVVCEKCEMVFCERCFATNKETQCSIGNIKHVYKGINDQLMLSMEYV